ncbi:MAG: sigma-70 family RNA polymerase sigma factor, partial [Nocardioidaceae bacterium]|nr:sigma-70 family RNA polymerase sigma factor [Nocardioidaceae bacterium]
MTDVLNDLDTPSDAELISRVRGGDVAAYGDLFARHKDAAQRLARQLVRGPDSDDLVSEAFAKVLSVLQSGGGPDVAFRAYLLTAVRRLHVDRVRSGQRLQTTDDLTPFDPGVPFQDTAVAGFESGAAAKAFASLPERWQLVLWHLEVEGQKPADIAPLLGMSANSVSALAYRAREGLRQAFLTMHISDITETDCRWVNEHLGAYVRKGLSKRDAAKVQQHLDGCRRCTAMYLELNEVNSNLAGIIAPLLLGAAATGYLASTGVGAAGLLGVVGRVKEFVAANTGAVAAGGVGAAVVAAAVTAIAVGGNGGGKPDVNADVPASITTNVAPSTSPASPSTSPSASASASLSPSPSPSLSLSPSPSSSVSALLPSTSPTDLASGETPTDTIAPPPPPLDLTGTSISDNGVNLVATADPLPPVLTVDLVSQPSGVVFSDTGACTKVSPTQAQCLTGSGAVGAGLPGQAVLTAASTFSTTLSFDQTQGPGNADVSISVNGQAASGAPHAFSRNVDVHFGLAQAASRPNDDGDSYSVDGSLSVDGPRAADVTGIRYSVSGGTFGNGETDVVRGADVANPSFTVVPDSQSDPNVHISASPQPAFNDTD